MKRLQDGVKYYYRFYFIRFKSTDDMAWIAFNGMPSVMERNKEAMEDIVSKVQNVTSCCILFKQRDTTLIQMHNLCF